MKLLTKCHTGIFTQFKENNTLFANSFYRNLKLSGGIKYYICNLLVLGQKKKRSIPKFDAWYIYTNDLLA
ncbi:hypothetical protein NARC_30108 [Candidatus Nitrosocosmicus arcticus]|uniref:Uncharacterized protein n=1 Tax=Candidatus Nitrosocosmicus arcticus TaxID=2035267 RepID=A0A557SXR3_9ARCH|nr:hypothetical protein NARC_30108 [Candidatus Nitrosocosmicus arcticus]